MKPALMFLISQSILIPLLIGLVRFKKIDNSYRPFLLLLLGGFLTETISFILIKSDIGNAVPTNIFILFEWIVLAWQFHVWGFLKTNKILFWLIVSLPVALWIIENIVFGHLAAFSPYFRFIYSFLVVLFSINTINYMIIHDSTNFFKNAKFLICLGLIIFFIYQIIYEWAYQLSTVEKSNVTDNIINLFGYVNALTNIIFAIAILFIPTSKKNKSFNKHFA